MQIYVLPLTWSDLGLRYTFAEVWPALAAADLNRALLVLGEPQFQAYDWTHQELWLTAEAGRQLAADGRDRLFANPLGQAFVVTLGTERLYGGLMYNPDGAAALEFPVMHALGTPRQVLRIRPSLGSAWKSDAALGPPAHTRIADPRIAAWLREHKLLVTDPPANRPPEYTGP